jgi:hypothetical protein
VYTKATNISKSTIRSTTHFVCFGNAHCSEWSPHTRKRDIEGGQNVIAPYFVFEALSGSKKYYLEMEKICYIVVMSARKLRHYFKAHRVRVLRNQLLNDIFRNRDSSGRIGKWATELSEHVIDFEKRSAAKSQVLAYFIADWTEPSSYTEGTFIDTPWQVYYDIA